MIYDIKKTDDTAAPVGRNKRISAEIVGRFLGRGAVWVRECIECQRILDGAFGAEVLRQLRRMKSSPLGIKSLLKTLHELQRTIGQGPGPAARSAALVPSAPAHALQQRARVGPSNGRHFAGPATKAAATIRARSQAASSTTQADAGAVKSRSNVAYREQTHQSSEYEFEEEQDYSEDDY